MIPTIEDIVRALVNGDMDYDEAVNHIHSHLRLARESVPGLDGVREHFAGLAMQALIAGGADLMTHRDRSSATYLAANAVDYADALIAELAKEPQR